jgi:DNA-binding transcriptional MocR family regulator
MFPDGDVLATIVDKVEDRSARGIAAALNRLITTGALPVGTRLPTVRDLARGLGVSPTTVSEAWQSLAAVGAIEARGRSGSFVRAGTPDVRRRYRDVTEGSGQVALDLSTGTPDPALLPDLSGALADVARQRLTRSYVDDPVLPSLGATLRSRWPFRPEALTVVDGAQDALDRIASAVVRFGDRVVVENPGFPPLFDLLDALGAELVPAALDDDGVRPDALAAALDCEPVAVFLQPRAQNPTGTSMSVARARELARLLRPHPGVLVVEDDHAGDIASAEPVSLGRWLPERTVLVRSFSKSHGPDLRLAAVGGAGGVVDSLVQRRLLGPGWSSRLLQAVLHALLVDPVAQAQVERAATVYRQRRRALTDALALHDIALAPGDGINLWLPVAEERRAQVAMAAAGVGVAPGHPFVVGDAAGDHLRVTVGLVGSAHGTLAAQLAAAAGGRRRGPVRPIV